MALRFVDSFDHYATADLAQKYSATNAATITAGRNNNGITLTYPGVAAYAYKALTTSGATAILGVALKFSTAPSTVHGVVQVSSASTPMFTLAVDTTQKLRVYRGSTSGTLLATGASVLTTTVWYYLELKVTLATGATGSYEVRVNNVSELTGSGVVTSPSATTWDGFYIGPVNGSGGMAWDDLYVLDGSGGVNDDFWGPVQIKAVFPDGAGNYTQMSPSAGSNYQCVDETSQNGDTDYVTETTVGEKDTYTFGAVGLTGVVKGVQTNLVVRSAGAGSETVAGLFRISGTDYTATAQSISTTYTDKTQVYDVSPATSAAWTVSEIDGAEFGPKLVS